jgi:hypothetical protein
MRAHNEDRILVTGRIAVQQPFAAVGDEWDMSRRGLKRRR